MSPRWPIIVKANIYAISSDTHQLYYIQLHHFTIIIIIIFDTVLRQKGNIEHEE